MAGMGLPWWFSGKRICLAIWLHRRHGFNTWVGRHSNILVWKILWTEKPGGLHVVARSQTPVSNNSSNMACMTHLRPDSWDIRFREVRSQGGHAKYCRPWWNYFKQSLSKLKIRERFYTKKHNDICIFFFFCLEDALFNFFYFLFFFLQSHVIYSCFAWHLYF